MRGIQSDYEIEKLVQLTTRLWTGSYIRFKDSLSVIPIKDVSFDIVSIDK
mgnify:CR=1 FL=1